MQGLAVAVAVAVSLTPASEGISKSDPNPDKAFEDTVSVGYVYVPIVVRSPKGYVSDLEREDFRLLVDGRPAVFDTFETGATAPVSVVVLQDLSGSMANAGKLEASREAVRYLLDQARPGDEFALAWFAGDIFQIDVPFTSDLAALREALDSWEAYGTTALQDAVAWLPRITPDRPGVKRAALLITDGVDNASTVGADMARQLVREAELPVYVLGLGSKPVVPAEDNDEGEQKAEIQRFGELLDLLASMTGGRYHALSGPHELGQACAEMLEDLRHQYVLGFTTGGAGRARDHRLEVVVAGRGKRALAFRSGYYGLDPEVN
jgi:Ca-activated chloride channel family protein